MKNIYLILSMLLPLAVNAEVSPPLKAGARLQLALPPIWDEATKTVQMPGSIMLNEAGTIETCSFLGGRVVVRKVDGGQVTFSLDPKVKGRCAELVTSVERFLELNPENVRKEKERWEKKMADFKAQLKEDVQGILERGADPCVPDDQELKTGSVYKVAGRVFVYGPGTSATSVDGGSCQVELGGLVHILGFNRASDFAVAEYHRPAESSGYVLSGASQTKTETCKTGEQVVFSLSKLKSHFQFAKPSTVENLQAKGIAAVFNAKAKICGNDPQGKGVSASRSPKREFTGGGSDGTDSAGSEPGQAGEESSRSAK